MRKQNIILSSLAGLYLVVGIPLSSLADDVYVDLSVLGALSSDSGIIADTAPLFPDVKNAPKITPKNKISKTKKKVSSKTDNIIKLKPAPKIVSAPIEEVKKDVLPELVVKTPDLSSESAQVEAQPVAKHVFEEAKKKTEMSISLPVSETKTEDVVVSVETEKAKSEFMANENNTPTTPAVVEQPESVSETSTPELLVEPKPEMAIKDTQVIFAEGSDELTTDNKRKLDAIIASFSNPTANMIAINSYNFDDGTDVFNKKRLSLRRIVAIRSYLLNLGYKNFMPKVVNLTDDASKNNVVELEEIK